MRSLALSMLVLGLALSAHGADGRIEINQASVDEAGGFPFAISQPGSYVLTSDLTVSAPDTDAIVVGASPVSLDLNGFRIVGPATCVPLFGCAQGVGRAVSYPVLSTPLVDVRNGFVEGFAGHGIQLSAGTVENVTVRFVGRSGIKVSSSGIVRGCTVTTVGGFGLELGPNVAFGGNYVSTAGIADASPTVIGGKEIAANFCADGRCSFPRRRYYLTDTGVDGASVLTACAAGFHMASLFELVSPASLRYDTNLGYTTADSGSGPPHDWGWIRTGKPDGFGGGTGADNCNIWSTTTGMGTIVTPWNTDWTQPADRIDPWRGSVHACDDPQRVWCVEE